MVLRRRSLLPHVNEGSQKGTRKRRQFTGKAMKLHTRKAASSIEDQSVIVVIVLERVFFGRTCKVLESESRVAELAQTALPLQDDDRVLVQKLSSTDHVLLYSTLVTDKVLPPGFLAHFDKLEQPARRSAERKLRGSRDATDAQSKAEIPGITHFFFGCRSTRGGGQSSTQAVQVQVATELLRGTDRKKGCRGFRTYSVDFVIG